MESARSCIAHKSVRDGREFTLEKQRESPVSRETCLDDSQKKKEIERRKRKRIQKSRPAMMIQV